MKKKFFFNTFFMLFCFVICFALLFSINNRDIPVVYAQEMLAGSNEEANSTTSTRELINSIEEELKQQGTSIVDVLKEQRDDYNSKISTGTLPDNNNLLTEKVEVLDNGINLYEKTNAKTGMIIGEENIYQGYPFYVAPDCECGTINIIMQSPCGYCIEYTNIRMGVLAISAAFSARGWKLAAELIVHNMSNTTNNSDYYPENGYRIAEAPQIADKLAYKEIHISGAFDHDPPGKWNGVFENTIEGDAYNALGSFYFVKNDAGNGNVSIEILDRYDWHKDEKYGIGEALNNTMFRAQELYIVRPFYTKINIVIPGHVPFGWRYIGEGSGIEITHSVSGNTEMVYPDDGETLDLRINPYFSATPANLDIDSIAENAFNGNSEITNITIPSSVISIGDNAFANMLNLKSVTLENKHRDFLFGKDVFAGCQSLTKFNSNTEGEMVVPSLLTELPSGMFRGTGFTYIDLGTSLRKIGDRVFECCQNLQDVQLPKSITDIGHAAFSLCFNLRLVSLSEWLEDIGTFAFEHCKSLTEICIPTKVKNIGVAAFRWCSSLKKIEFLSRGNWYGRESLQLATGVFADCYNLKNLVIPEFVTSLGNGAFENVNLNTVYYDGSRAAYAKLKANSSANDNFFNADTYFYSANKPFSGTNYWRYDSDGTPEIWPSKQLQGITANGESRAVTTDAIVITFDSDPGENFGVNNVYTNGANVDAVSGSGMTRVVTVSDVTVRDGEKLKLELKPAGDYYFVNPEIEVAVCVKVCKIFYYEAGKNFFSGDISDCPTEYMEGQTTKLGTPTKFGFEFDGWHLNEDGSGERIYNITPDYRGDITLYAKWKSYDRLPWDSEHIKVMYYTENAETTLDMLFKSDDGLGESSYYIREALFPALAQLNADGYGYELNSTLISEYYPSDDKVSARIVLNDGLKFSSDNDLTANDFKAYYDFIVNAYEDLPEPWKYISGFVANDSRALEITLTRPYDIMYVLSELRAVDSELLGELSGMTTEAANACVYAKAADVVTYGRYKIGEISEVGGILLMPNEKYTFYNENSACDITLNICGDFQEAGAKYFRGETDACYNLNEEDILDILGNEELHAYDDRVRMYLGLNKDSTALAQYGEADKQKIIYALGLLIDYDRINTKFGGAEHENNKWFPDGYPFEGMPADDGFDNEWISGINYQSDIVDRQMKARMIFDTLGINPEEFELTLTVKNKRRYTELAAILQSSFEAVGMRLVVNVVATDDETNGGDLLFVFYDFTGKVIADEDFLEKDNLNLIFSPCGYDEEAIIRRLTEKYEEAETETEKQEILGEIQSIMAFYAVKINHINKYYLARPEYFEFTNGHPANLVY